MKFKEKLTLKTIKIDDDVDDQVSKMSELKHHTLKIVFFQNPVLCCYCKDYIWGSGFIGYTCEECHKCLHAQCKVYLSESNICVPVAPTSPTLQLLNKKLRQTTYKIEDLWTVNEVKEWLAVVNLHRFSESFSMFNVSGETLKQLDQARLIQMRILDVFHHDAIFTAIKELQLHCNQTYDQMKTIEALMRERQMQPQLHFKAKDHHFLIATLTSSKDCGVCSRPLLGIIHQGLQCQICGLIVHRQCSYLGLCACKQQIQRAKFIQYYVFGVSLFDLMNEYVEAPALLQKAFNDIETRGVEFSEDLYDVYRLSADTKKVERLKQQLNENGVELTQFIFYDLNTIAAIVKAFLRELQNSVIPEEEYKTICKLAVKTTTTPSKSSQASSRTPSPHQTDNEFVNHINTLHPIHLKCLKYIMRHLIRVWKYQYEFRNFHYLPDKLIHIFRIILMRPPWESIIDIVYNLDVQALVLKRLLLEYDWGIELPKYKERPQVPPTPSNAVLSFKSSLSPSSSLQTIPPATPLTSSTNQLTASNIIAECKEEKKFTLNEMPWYFGDITRDDTLMLLRDCAEGTFLVRDSSEKQTILMNHDELHVLYMSRSSSVSKISTLNDDDNNNYNNNAYGNPKEFKTMASMGPAYGLLQHGEHVVSPYTLCLLKGTAIKSIKIFYDLKTQHFDIQVPCRFVNLKDLIEYYTLNSLKDYNISLDLKLGESLSKYRFGKTTEWNLERLYASYRDAYQQYENSVRKSEGIQIEIETIYEDLKNKLNANAAFEKIIKMYEQQIDMLNKNLVNNQQNTQIHENEEKFVKNIELLSMRIHELNEKRRELIVDCDYLNIIVQQLQDELEQLRPDLIEMRKKRENYHMWLIQRGENDEKIMQTLKSPTVPKQEIKQLLNKANLTLSPQLSTTSSISPTQSTSSVNPTKQSVHENSINWYSANSTRADAEKILKNSQNGTYLVRASRHKYINKASMSTNESEPNHNISTLLGRTPSSDAPSTPSTTNTSKYVLSLMHKNEVIHCLIEEDEQGCYIKLNNENKSNIRRFTTLTNLIVYYSKNSLKNYNPSLDTCLLYPAFLNGANR